jgi:two-component system, LytTR family, sensor kinase
MRTPASSVWRHLGPRASSSRERRAFLYFGFWTLIGLLFSLTMIAQAWSRNEAIAWSSVGAEQFRWYLWALLTPLIFWQAGRFPLERKSFVLRLLINIAIGLVITSLFLALNLLKNRLFGLDFSAPGFFRQIEYHLLTYFAISAATHAFLYYDKLREREVKTSRLEAQLAYARLEVLKMQLHPHFLFNTLNAISALMHRDVDAADKMITHLADLLRLSLDQDERLQVPLKDELEFLERYLAIEKIRFRDRLKVEIDVEASCLDAQVPRLILQPLVENAIRHGIARRSAAGAVTIRARRKGGHVDISVADDGPGLPAEHKLREGVGLANTKARLKQLYAGDSRVLFEKAPIGGLLVRLEFPFEEIPRFPSGPPVSGNWASALRTGFR